MTYKVVYSPKSIKNLEKLDRPTLAMIYGWIEKNLVDCTDPRAHGKSLTGDKSGYWRYRVGAYRLLAEIDDGRIQIAIINVGHRREIYR